jgi:hypothetical protein
MNIFILDKDPKVCAEYHCDKHTIKMILEGVQLLCGSHWSTGGSAPYKLSHKNHPCSIWTRECVENYVWLCDLTMELCKEYTYRYGKKHKSQSILEWCMINIPDIRSNGDITPFPLAMPDEYKVNCPVESYRNYYRGAKSKFATWKNREVPYWYKTNLN